MIIWSGFGILVGLIGIAGLVAGSALGNPIGHEGIAMGLGMMIATALNWLLCKKLYSKEPRVLVDPKTGQHVLLKPSHSLFFIPARAWTWIFALLIIPASVLGTASESTNRENAATPGHEAFTAAEKLIEPGASVTAHGSDKAAHEIAGAFSGYMREFTAVAFTDGKSGESVGEHDHFTYCQMAPDHIVLLCTVPKLHKYRAKEAKNALADVAWTAASLAISEAAPEAAEEKTVTIALRGLASYGLILQGRIGKDQTYTTLRPSDLRETVYPAFAAGAP